MRSSLPDKKHFLSLLTKNMLPLENDSSSLRHFCFPPFEKKILLRMLITLSFLHHLYLPKKKFIVFFPGEKLLMERWMKNVWTVCLLTGNEKERNTEREAGCPKLPISLFYLEFWL